MRRHTELYRAFLDFMADYDALICPAMAVPPFPHRQLYVEAINGQKLRTYFHWLALAYGLTLTAHPVACIPCGRDQTGMPFGIQVCGRRFGDRRDARDRRSARASPPDHPRARAPAARPRQARGLTLSFGAGRHERIRPRRTTRRGPRS